MPHAPTTIRFRAPDGEAFSLLAELLSGVRNEDVALLRPLPNPFEADRDDVDLLLTPESRALVHRRAFELATAGRLHVHLEQSRRCKSRLTLWTSDGTRKVSVDLWTAFTQCGPWRNRAEICASDLLRLLDNPASDERRVSETCGLQNVSRFPADVEFCLYVLHLSAKRRSIRCERVQQRLKAMTDRLNQDDSIATPWLQTAPAAISELEQITTDHWVAAFDHLSKRLAATGGSVQTGPRDLMSRAAAGVRRWLNSRAPCFSVSGPDGVGKTTLLTALTQQHASMQVLVAKKLYRRSVLYQIIGGVWRRLSGDSRCRFDDRVAPLLAVRASAALWLRLLLRTVRRENQTLLLDRGVTDVLIRDRKSDQPRTWRGSTALQSLAPPVASILLASDAETLSKRKGEMTPAGSQIYQRLLFEQVVSKPVFSLLVFDNSQPVEASSVSLMRCIDSTLQRKIPSSSNPPVAHQSELASGTRRAA